ncbi:Integrase [Tropicimonas sediminicola]|uniref:Integrase n=2 Tax=Tropicimonas sediminicola TaxID=1031541 RepID=A0A239MFW6_9RHOB|nr:Integrase [Tropicimonas sediminicola]
MGLGSVRDVSLKEARAEAERWRGVARRGQDPIKERQRLAREAERNMYILKDIAEDAFESRKADLKEDGKAGRWFSPLKLYVLPKLGAVPVSQIDQQDIRDALRPIWHTKADTARKAMNRLGICFQHAAALGLDVDLQATEKAKALLGRQKHKVQHVPALPWQEVSEFYASLSDGTITHLALRLLILTAVRSKPLRFLRLEQINGSVWTIPGEIQKGLRDRTPDFAVPLSAEAQAIVEQAKPFSRDGYLFPSVRRGVISDATMSRLMERRGMEARPHGFRSSFRDWCAEAAAVPHEVAETALGHVIGGSVERAYRRTDYLEQRRVVMERWAEQVVGGSSELLHMVRQ